MVVVVVVAVLLLTGKLAFEDWERSLLREPKEMRLSSSSWLIRGKKILTKEWEKEFPTESSGKVKPSEEEKKWLKYRKENYLDEWLL